MRACIVLSESYLPSKGKTRKPLFIFKKPWKFSLIFWKRITLGYVFAQQGEYDRAIQRFSEALRINPKIAELQANLAVVYVCKGNSVLAAQA